jgi:hypothetical protein
MAIYFPLSAPRILHSMSGLKMKRVISNQENNASTNRNNSNFFEIIASVP